MQITRRQFGLAMVLGALALALSRMFGFLFHKRPADSEVSGGRYPAKYWKRADHLGG